MKILFTTIISFCCLALLAPTLSQAQVVTETEPNQTLSAERMFAPDRLTEINIELATQDWDKILALGELRSNSGERRGASRRFASVQRVPNATDG